MKSQIHLIRHGITEGNQKRWYYGSSDLPLASEGVKELEKLVEEGIYPRAEEGDFYTSGLLRTEQTFSLIFGRQEHGQIEELKEMGFGEFEKKSYEDLKEVPEYQEWISDESGASASPGGESILGFNERIHKGFEKLLGKHKLRELAVRHSGKEAVSTVVCHGGVIAAIMGECFPDEKKQFYQWIPDPGHGYTLCMKAGKVTDYQRF